MAQKMLIGEVVSNKMHKTVVVEVERKIQHPLYKKVLKRRKRFKAASNTFELVLGDVVKIVETRPVSRDTHFKVIEKLNMEK